MKYSILALVAAFTIGLSGAAFGQQADEASRKLSLAKQFMDLSDVTKSVSMMVGMLVEAVPIDESIPAPVARAIRESALESTQALLPAIIDRFADLYAQTFTLDELEGIVAFHASPAGRALVQKSGQLMGVSGTLMEKEFGPEMERQMLDRLCRKIDCSTDENKRALRKTWG